MFAPIVCRLWSLPNPRAQGSGNPGATNVYRIGGWLPAGLTLLLDAAKGALPVYAAAAYGLGIIPQAFIGLCAITGHMLPVFARFQGGKGVATALGAGVALAPALLEPDALPLFGLLALLILVRHRDNLIRLAQHREPPV